MNFQKDIIRPAAILVAEASPAGLRSAQDDERAGGGHAAATLSSADAAQEWQADLIGLLNDALATELVCVLRYKRHHFTAHGLESSRVADEFMVHANEEAVHADRIARRIVQLGGEPDFAPESLAQRSHAVYDDSLDLHAMMVVDLTSERLACESYKQLIKRIGERDSTTRRLLEDILSEEQAHASELAGWLSE
jgi:bacterioferritin